MLSAALSIRVSNSLRNYQLSLFHHNGFNCALTPRGREGDDRQPRGRDLSRPVRQFDKGCGLCDVSQWLFYLFA